MPAPYTIRETAASSGLSVKFIRRMKEAMPHLFEKHVERGPSNALLFDEEMIEVLKRTRELKNRGRSLQQIREELSALVKRPEEKPESPSETLPHWPSADTTGTEHEKAALTRENVLLRSQVTLLQDLLRRAEERFDRLLPERTQQQEKPPVKESLRSQLLLWIVEAVVVTVFASGFVFLIWYFGQKAITQ